VLQWKGRGAGQLAYLPLDLFYNVAMLVTRWIFSMPVHSLDAVHKLRVTVNSAAFRSEFVAPINAYGLSCFGIAMMQVRIASMIVLLCLHVVIY
jgi:hypothetical protein